MVKEFRVSNGATGRPPACDFVAVVLQRESQQNPQAGGLRYLEKILNLASFGVAFT